MNTAFFLRTRTIQLDIFGEGTFYGSKPGGFHQLWEGWRALWFALCRRQHYRYLVHSSCDSVGTSHVRLIGKKLRKYQPRRWTCNTERSSKKCQYIYFQSSREGAEAQCFGIGNKETLERLSAIGSHSCCETNQPYSTHQITHPCGWVSAAKRAPGLHPATKSDQTGHRGYHIFSTLLVGGMNMAKHGTIKSDQVSQFKNCHQLPVNPSNGSICFIHKIKKPMVPVTRDSISLSAINLPCQSSLFEQQFRENQRLSPNPPKNTPA